MNTLAIILYLALIVEADQILSQFQSGQDDSTIQNPLKSPGQISVNIQFENSYSSIPEVLIYLTSISVQKTSLQDYKVEATQITTKGFSILYTIQQNAETVSLRVSWIAFEKNVDAEVIYKEVNGNNVANDGLQQTFKSDTFPITFQNQYANIPNIAIFLLGVSSLKSQTDSFNINFSDATQYGCNVAVSAWNFGLLNKASFAMLVVHRNVSISQYGSQNNNVGGNIDSTNAWIDTTKSNRVLQKTQTSSKNLSPTTDSNSKILSISGFTGYDVRFNLYTNLKIGTTSFSESVFTQTVETWGQSQVVAGYWYSMAINTTVNSLSSSDSGLKWWIILIIVLAIIFVIALVIIIIICLEKRKRKLNKPLEVQDQSVVNKEESKNDISKNETKNQDLSNINKNLNQDNTNSIMIKDRSYVDDYIPHKQNQNTKREVDNIFLNNTNFISPKNSSTETNLDQSKKITYLGGNVEQSPTLTSYQRSMNNNQQTNKQQTNIQYYQNPRKQYEIVNNYQDEENSQTANNQSNMNQQSNIQSNEQTLPGTHLQNQTNQNNQVQTDQFILQIQQQNPNPQNNANLSQISQVQSQTYQPDKENSQILNPEQQTEYNSKQQNEKPIDKTLVELEKHINNYNKEQQNQSFNQSQISQDIEQNDEMKQIKQTNYDVYRQILQNKSNFDKQQTNQPTLTTPLPQNNTKINDNNIPQKPNTRNHILNNRQYLDSQANENVNSNNNIGVNNNNSSSNFYSNSSTYRPLQHSSRLEDQKLQNQNNNLSNHPASSLSQVGNMIVNGYGNQAAQNKNNYNQETNPISPYNIHPIQNTQKEKTLNNVDSVYKNIEPTLYTNKKGSDFLSYEDEEDMPRRPKNNYDIPNI